MDVIIRNAKRLQNLSEDILDVTRIESKSLVLKKEKFKNRINQVISNLLVNAIKFTKNGTITITTDIEKSPHYDKKGSDVVVIAIKDSGSGIDSKVFPKLFTKFASGSQGGTGLGLFISKNIIEAHGGKMWAENNQNNNGATFSFTLPTVTYSNGDMSHKPHK